MGVMRTLTINGQKYTVDDPNAVQIPETAPEKGAVPTSDGEGGTEWEKPSGSEIPSNGTTGQVLTKTEGGFGWEDLPEQETELPTGGSAGQILTKTAEGVAWGDAPSGTFIVTATVDGAITDGITLTPDKTVAEIIAAHDAGQNVYFSLTSNPADGVTLEQTLPLVDIIEEDAMSVLDFGGSAIGVAVSVQMTHNNNAGDDVTNLSIIEMATADQAVPTGGSAGQVLTKESDGSVSWNDVPQPEDEIPTGATEGQVLTADADGNPVWADFPEQDAELPTGGTAGQVLTIGSDGSPVWADPTTLTSVYEGVF